LIVPSDDKNKVKLWFLIALLAVLATAQSQSATPPPASEPAQPPDPPVKFAITHAEEARPQYVRIFNLPEGMREIVLPPVYHTVDESAPKTRTDAEPQPIRILNLEEGTREIATPREP
jgi:hypothetical protein